MSNPIISAVCVTYGRTRLLASAIHDFMQQDCPGPKEMVILNTFPKQNLSLGFNFHDIRIENLTRRPDSLGAARNKAIELASGDVIVTWDDDDAYLPHLLSTFATHFDPDTHWVWLDKRLFAEGDQIKGIKGGCHGGCFAFRKSVWAEVAGYPEMTVGEDRIFVSKITSRFNGKKVSVDSTPPFICCWSNGAYHISGEGDDTPDKMPAHERARIALSSRISAGLEKTGTIVIKPTPMVEWEPKVREYMESLKKKPMNNHDVCIVQLGRYGDIVNMLPIALHVHNNYGKPHVMVSREFASILEGVSYVIPTIVDLDNNQLNDAIRIANEHFGHVIVTQIWGKNWHQERLTDAYNKESYRQAGLLHKFGKGGWHPVFDRRDAGREQALLNKATGGVQAPIIVVAAKSTSSPFPRAAELLAALRSEFGQSYTVLDITELRAEKIYDILGILDAARLIITVDTAVLHLAQATTTPVIALTNPAEWLGTVPMHTEYLRIPYSAITESFTPLIEATNEICREQDGWSLPFLIHAEPSPHAPPRKLIHAVEMHPAVSPSEENRRGIAQASWKPLYAAGVLSAPYHESIYHRSAQDIGDPRHLPFLKDVLQHAMSTCRSQDDIIFWTNDDNYLHRELPDMLRYHVGIYDCCCSQRCEFTNAPMPPANTKPVEFAIAGRAHMGRDLFAFTKRWLDANWDQIPDFILGASDFDLCLACMIRNHFGIKSTRQNLEDCIFPAELPRGYVSHQYHPPAWNRPHNTNTAPSQLHNRRLFKEWASVHAPHLTFDKFNCI